MQRKWIAYFILYLVLLAGGLLALTGPPSSAAQMSPDLSIKKYRRGGSFAPGNQVS